MIDKSELITLIAEALHSKHPTRIERNDGGLRVTLADGRRFAIEVNLDEDDYDDCARESWPEGYTLE
jgi:hypothetical protein